MQSHKKPNIGLDKKVLDDLCWNVIDIYFKDNPNVLVSHHLDSYNDFLSNGISRILKDRNPIILEKDENKDGEYLSVIEIYFGGLNGNSVFFSKPIIYDDVTENQSSYAHFMYPNEARLRNMTYGMTVHCDVVVKYRIYDPVKKENLVETVELIKQNSIGFSKGLELLTNFDNADSLRMVFIYIRELKKNKYEKDIFK